MGVHPFTIDVEERVLEDLRARLRATRWTDALPGAGWSYGADVEELRALVDYWAHEFDWRTQERALNRLPQFRCAIGDVEIHFVHVRGTGPDPKPLVLSHGWPSSFLELLKVIPLLADPAAHGGDARDAFDVIVPSLPGFGFSSRPTAPGATNATTAELWLELTRRLGYERVFAHGGDVGAGVTTRMAAAAPERLAAIHITAVSPARLADGSPPLSEAERAYLEADAAWEEAEGAYAQVQSTKPQTLATALDDSPAGLAAWIVEKFRTWSDCGGDVLSRFTRDELLSNVTLYWVTRTIGSSMRLYAESARHAPPLPARIEVPTAICQFPNEHVPEAHPPREWAERTYDVRRFTRIERGGHFPALEEPELLVHDIRESFRGYR